MKNWQFFLLLSQLSFMMASPKADYVLIAGAVFATVALYAAYRERRRG